jgi:zinc transport system substrate-binding protein
MITQLDTHFPKEHAMRISILITVAVLLAVSGPAAAQVLAGTSLIADIWKDVAGPGEPVSVLIPPAMCPGHFDMKPSDIEAARTCRMVLLHPWQQQMSGVKKTLEAAGVGEDRVRVVDVSGNWMAPDAQREAVKAVFALASAGNETLSPEMKQRTVRRVQRYEQALAEARGRLAEVNPAAVKVLCSGQQEDLVRWAGFDIVAVFGRPEDMSMAAIEQLNRKARESGARLIIDNLQSGDVQLGKTLASDTGTRQVVLSNFPGAFENTDTWDEAFLHNIGLLVEAAGEPGNG